MKTNSNLLLFLLALVLIPLSVGGELNLKSHSPDEPSDYTFNKRFSHKNSLWRLNQIREALQSFHKLTEKTRNTLSSDELAAIGNTSPETHLLGFKNWPDAIEGTLRKQQYLIKKLEYELAGEKLRSGRINKSEYERIKAVFEKEEEI